MISDLVTVAVESGKYRSMDEARGDFIDWFAPPGQSSFLETNFTVKDLTYTQAQNAIDLYHHMIAMPSFQT